MRSLSLALVVSFVGLMAVQCETSSGGGAPQSIHPQPQPNSSDLKFTSPCTAAQCGEAPASVGNPRCKPAPSECAWSEDSSVSYRQCPVEQCGAEPGQDVCPVGTVFRGSACGSENEAACAWSTVCAPPPSTTPCRTGDDGCGPKPLLGVVCQDGGTGDLACMQFAGRCAWQRTCD